MKPSTRRCCRSTRKRLRGTVRRERSRKLVPRSGHRVRPRARHPVSAAENAAVRILPAAVWPTEKIECKRIKLSSVARALLVRYRYPAKPTERGKSCCCCCRFSQRQQQQQQLSSFFKTERPRVRGAFPIGSILEKIWNITKKFKLSWLMVPVER